MARKKMKVIIAGPRDFNDYDVVCDAIEKSDFLIKEVVSGAANGVDTLGVDWAKENKVKFKEFPADWNNINAPDALVKENKWGKKFNARAGFDRNQKMAEYADALIAIDTGSSGTGDMIKRAKKEGLPVFKYDPLEHADEGDVYVF